MESSSAVPRLAYTVPETSTALGISRAAAYHYVRAGAIRAVKVQGRYLVPAAELDRLLAGGVQ